MDDATSTDRRQFLQGAAAAGAAASLSAIAPLARAVTTSQPFRRPPTFYGVNIDAPYPDNHLAEYPHLIKALTDAGVGTVRTSIAWRYVEATKGTKLWAPTDKFFATLPEKFEVLMLMLSTPAWASGVDPAKCVGWFDTYMPRNYDDWGNFFYESVKRYRNRVKYWEVWNEENGIDFFHPKPDATAYVKLLKTAYAAAKKADPNCQIVLGGLQMNGVMTWSPERSTPNFLEAIYKAGGGPFFDICNIHPYVGKDQGAPYLMALTGDTRKVMAKYGDKDKPLWLTETGTATGHGTTAEDQAHLLATCYEAAAAYPGIDRVYWFTFRDAAQDVLGFESTMGIVTSTWKPKPAFEAFRKLATQS